MKPEKGGRFSGDVFLGCEPARWKMQMELKPSAKAACTLNFGPSCLPLSGDV